MERNIVSSLLGIALSAFALANCPGPRPPQWNGNYGRCVEGLFGNYCQDTELIQDGDCNGSATGHVCTTSTIEATKHIYAPRYSGNCTLDQITNPCDEITPDPPDKITYHDPLVDVRHPC